MLDADAINSLKKVPLFDCLSDEALANLAVDVTYHTLEQGEVLFRRGDPGDSAYIICDGWVKIVIDGLKEEDELILAKVGPGEIVGEVALLDQQPRSASVIALTPVTCYRLEDDDFMQMLNDHPQVGLDMMRNLTARLRFADIYIEKVIEFAQRITEGDYSFAMHEIQTTHAVIKRDDEDRADELLATFFNMVRQIKEREDRLKAQVQTLTIKIDYQKQQRDVDDLTRSSFFDDLLESTRKLRQERDEQDES